MKKRLLTVLLSFAVLLSCFPAASMVMAEEGDYESMAAEENNVEIPQGGETLGSFDMLPPDVQALVTEVEEKTGNLSVLTIDKVKSLYDFAGNLYYVVEYVNSGFVLFHAESLKVPEYSEGSLSPYAGYDKGLYYCGPMWYFYDDNGIYRHTIFEDSFSAEDVPAVVETCRTLNEKCIASAEQEKADNSANTRSISDKDKCISNFEIISKLKSQKSFGYYSQGNGCCGYVAAGLLLLWYDKGKRVDDAINDFAYIKNNAFRGEDFTRYLRSLGSRNDSMATSVFFLDYQPMDEVLKKYAEQRHLTMDIETRNAPFTSSSVISWLKKYDAPVIYFGTLIRPRDQKEVDHAVLAYGRTPQDQIIVHMGYEGYPDNKIDASLLDNGSMLCVTSLYGNSVFFFDIPYNNWAYTAAQYCKRYGIIDNGSSSFNPTSIISRGAFVNAMYQLAGAPKIENAKTVENKFTDFGASTAYHDAIVWAYQKGILTGTSSTKLSPFDGLTREQAATFLYRFSNSINCTFSAGGPNANTFIDYNKVSDYAKTTMTWATTRRLINGSAGSNGKLYLLPQSYLQRDQAAQLIYNYATRGYH